MSTSTKFKCLLIVLLSLALSNCAKENSTAQFYERSCSPATVEDIRAVKGVLKTEVELTNAQVWQGESSTPGRFVGAAVNEEQGAVGVWVLRGDKVGPMGWWAVRTSLDLATLGLTKEDLRWDDEAVNGAAECVRKSLELAD